MLLGTDGPYHDVVKIRPPMPFDADDADGLVACFARVLGETSLGSGTSSRSAPRSDTG